MLRVYPDYYKDFRCIASRCAHNCCVGWEIDIDGSTLEKYGSVTGELGERLKRGISFDGGVPHFKLSEGERCPFLNSQNLCDIISGLGEEYLCGICREHPRFYSELPGRVEVGIGLCCEEAARIILGRREPVRLMCEGDSDESDDELIVLRDRAIACLQDRTLGISERADRMKALCEISDDLGKPAEWAEYLMTLERLDEAWTEVLSLVRDKAKSADLEGFARHMESRLHEYEQLLVYFVYRHMACASDVLDAAARGAFAIVSCELIFTAGACMWILKGEFTFEDQVELVRLFSSEIEYSEENLNAIFDELY